MKPLRRFVFSFDVSREFLDKSPVAAEYVEACKARIAARKSVTGPRGGLYRLVTPPDRWLASNDRSDYFVRNTTLFETRREGRYVPPSRITPDLLLGDTIHFDMLTVPALEGTVVLPSGATVQTESHYVSFPVLVP